jgi:hypothetical protein
MASLEEQLRPNAQLYPNLMMGMTKGRIVCPDDRSERVMFTNDYATAGYDRRHFID